MGNLLSRAEITEADIKSAAETLLPMGRSMPWYWREECEHRSNLGFRRRRMFLLETIWPLGGHANAKGGWTLTKGHLEILFTNEGRMD